jgi:hypothetical protein
LALAKAAPKPITKAGLKVMEIAKQRAAKRPKIDCFRNSQI